MRKALFKDMSNSRSAGYRLNLTEAAMLPKGSIFCDKMGRWLVTTKLSPTQIVDKLATVNWQYRSKLAAVKEMVGKKNVLAIRFAGSMKSGWTSEKKLGEIPKLPTLMGGYQTVANGWGEEFSSYSVKEGETFEFNKNTYYCVYEKYRRGNAECFSTASVIAVKLS
jgi:hypothetical protein